MRKQAITILLLMVALTIIFLIMSCGRADQNQNTANSNQTPTPITRDPCDATDVDQLEASLREAINKEIKDVNDLKNHNGTDHNADPKKPYLKYELLKVTSVANSNSNATPNPNPYPFSVYVFFEGRISGKDVMVDVAKSVEKHVKKKCAFRVFFVKGGTLPLTQQQKSSPNTIEGFEWSGCDYPMIACPDGECRSSCDSINQ
jgi:hypothetical protein